MDIKINMPGNKFVFFLFLNACWIIGAILITHYYLGSVETFSDIAEFYSHFIVATVSFGFGYWLEEKKND